MPWLVEKKVLHVLLYILVVNLAGVLGAIFLVGHSEGLLLGALELAFWTALNLCLLQIPQFHSQRVRSGIVPVLLSLVAAFSLIGGGLLVLLGHHWGWHVLVLVPFLFAGLGLAALRRRYEEKHRLDPAFLRRLSDFELDILRAVIVIHSTSDNPFSAIEGVLGGDPFDTGRLQRWREVLDLLIEAGYVSHKVPPGAAVKELAIHPEAEVLFLAERERREALWDAPASIPGPRQRPSVLAERGLAR